MARKTHKMTWRSWDSMWARCTRPSSANYWRYGGAGIRVCQRWESFENFLADMGERPVGHTLDRKDPTKDYDLSNCRWATPAQQARTRRSTKLTPTTIAIARQMYAEGWSQVAIAKALNVKQPTISNALNGVTWR